MKTRINLFKMADGSELIATVIDDTHTNYMVASKVRAVLFQKTETGVTVGFPPWSQVAGDSIVEISRSHIVLTLSALPKELEDAYLEATSGILLT